VPKANNNRKYIRINSVLPVQATITDIDKNVVWKTSFFGFTKDINEAGVCLEINNFDDNLAENLIQNKYLLFLSIDLPNLEEPVQVYSTPCWIEKVKSANSNKYKIGVSFVNIHEKYAQKIIKYAYKLHRRPKQIFLLICFFVLLTGISFFYEMKFRILNNKLSKELIVVKKEKDQINSEINKIARFKAQLEANLAYANQEIEKLSLLVTSASASEIATPQAITAGNIPAYSAKLEQLKFNREDLKKQLVEVVKKEEVLVQKKETIQAVDISLSHKKTELMYNWLKKNQSVHTGLVNSYEGDPELENFAFTYDQALSILNFVDKGDYANAKRTIDFFVFKARKNQGGYLNAYNVDSGYVLEWTAHAGPNAWLGIGMLKYIEKTKNMDYLKYVMPIAEYILALQDAEGGIRGGEDLTWYSTEHNVDCHSFLRMMYTVTNNSRYKLASDKILEWMKKRVYIKAENRIWRGKNDSKIATDTVSFGIPAIGPKALYANDMDPEKLIQYMENTTKVTTTFTNNKGLVLKITGFDYTDPAKIGRKGVISSEWTAQMVTTYQVMADYFKAKDQKKYEYYNLRADFYNNELEKMLISLDSAKGDTAGLPYSTGHVDTGHGWQTPKSPFVISIAGTAYTLLARYKNNPFCLDKEKQKYYL
jgi:hypothetical protein